VPSSVLDGARPLTTTMAKDAQGPTSATEQPDYADAEIHVVHSPDYASDDPEDARQRVDSSDHPPGSFHQPQLPRIHVCNNASRRARCVPDRPGTSGISRVLTATDPRLLTWAAAAQRAAIRSLPSWSCRFDPGRPLHIRPAQGLSSQQKPDMKWPPWHTCAT
jgi:hypothetical protein